MKALVRRQPVVGACFVLCTALLAAQDRAGSRLTAEEIEAFLLKARILDVRDVGLGVTGSQVATLTDGGLTHEAHVQSVDIARPFVRAGGRTERNFRDTYRYNIAAYRLARLVGIRTVPVSVERTVDGKPSAVTWWVDNVQMDEMERIKRNSSGPDPARTVKQIQVMYIWDELVQNRDRNQGNVLWTTDWTLWLIDHTRAFRLERQLLRPDQLTRCDRGLLERLRALTPASLARAVGPWLSSDERAALLARRDRLVKHFEERIATIGEAVVLFDL